jgi:hypothetical protein
LAGKADLMLETRNNPVYFLFLIKTSGTTQHFSKNELLKKLSCF